MHKNLSRMIIFLGVAFAPGLLAQSVWDGDGDPNASGNWNVANNWNPDGIPGNATTTSGAAPLNDVQLNTVSAGNRTVTMGDDRKIISLTMNQSAAGSFNILDINTRTLRVSQNSNSSLTITGSSAQNNVINIAGGEMNVDFASISAARVANFGLATINLTGNNSRIYTSTTGDFFARQQFGGVVNVTGSSNTSVIARFNTSGTANIAVRHFIDFLAGSEVNISSGNTLDLLYNIRSTSSGRNLEVTNNGTINLNSGATLRVRRDTSVSGTSTTSNASFDNLTVGILAHAGTLVLGSGTTGTQDVRNFGSWRVTGSAAVISSQTTGITPSFTNNSSGTITGSSSSDILEYNRTGTGGRMAIQNQGILSPGNGHNGSGTSSVGELSFRDINVGLAAGSTLRLDIGGTTSGLFDVLTLANGATDPLGAGTLTIATGAGLALYYVNGFNPTSGFSITILNYGAVSGSFDLASNLSIFGASGIAANPSNYSIAYGTDSAVLTLVPEPASCMLFAMGAAFMLWRRRGFSR